jgi:hypothetical protein
MSNNDCLEIYPGKGIGPILLGMHPQRVVSIFHEKQVYESWMGGNLNDAILFHGMRLHFDKCNGAGPLPGARLVLIVVHQREDAILFGRRMKDWSKEEIFQYLDDENWDPEKLANGDICTKKPYLEMSFLADGKLIWLETG